MLSSWNGGYQLNFTVTDNGTKATNGWKVAWTWPGSQTVTQIWNANETQSGATVTATNLSYNGSIAPGGSTTFGMLGGGTAPTALSGITCTAS